MAATITIVCPHGDCRRPMRAAAEHVGKRARCPSCKRIIEIRPPEGEFPQIVQPTASRTRRGEQPAAAGTQANMWLAGIIGAAATTFLYLAIFVPLSHTGLGQFMLDRSWIQHSITLVTCWGLSLLVLKYLAVRRELGNAELELELIPLEIGLQITPDNVEQFLDHLGKLPPAQQHSILARRIKGALEHFKHRNSVPEVQGYLSTQAEIEASGVDSGYTLLRAFIWVCPILGFIGTVWGIGQAVTDLQKTMPAPAATASAEDPTQPPPAAPKPPQGEDLTQKLLVGMKGVTEGLATAFDTTLLGLVCVVFLMFPCEILRKTEYAMLDRVEEFANESLLRRMAESQDGAAASGELPETVRRTLESAFKEHQRWLAQWQAQVSQLGQAIGADFETQFGTLQARLAQSEGARLESIQRAGRVVEEMFEQVVAATQSWQKSGGGDLAGTMRQAEQLQQALAANTAVLHQVVSHQKQAAERYAATDLGEVLRGLQEVLVRLNDKVAAPEVLAPVATAAPRGGFLGRMLGRNSKGAT
jgi:biopolymer transport protein ExbB/TolQ